MSTSLRKHKKRQEQRHTMASPRHTLSLPQGIHLADMGPVPQGFETPSGDESPSTPGSPSLDQDDSIGDDGGSAGRTMKSAMRLNKVHHDYSAERRQREAEADVRNPPFPPLVLTGGEVSSCCFKSLDSCARW